MVRLYSTCKEEFKEIESQDGLSWRELHRKTFLPHPWSGMHGCSLTAQPVGLAGWLVLLPIPHTVLEDDLRNSTKLHKAFFFLVLSPRYFEFRINL